MNAAALAAMRFRLGPGAGLDRRPRFRQWHGLGGDGRGHRCRNGYGRRGRGGNDGGGRLRGFGDVLPVFELFLRGRGLRKQSEVGTKVPAGPGL